MVISDLFTIGYRCTADFLTKKMGQRHYSSPFSSILCDLETALFYIDNEFDGFRDVVKVVEPPFIWIDKLWGVKKLFINKNFISDDIVITNWKKVLLWNHQNLEDKDHIETSIRREKRLITALKKDTATLLVYVGNIQPYTTEDLSFYINRELMVNFCKKHTTARLLILVPILDFPNKPILIKEDNINIIYYESNAEGYGNEIGSPNIEWDAILDCIKGLYDFRIV